MRRFKKVTRGLNPVKHSTTLVDNTGPGVGSFFGHEIYRTALTRGTSGGVSVLQQNINNEEQCQVGDIIKYINICLECSPRGVQPTNELDNAGWLEWAVIFQEERNVLPTVANIGVLTLGAVCSHIYRENCIMTGCFPLGTKQAMSTDIKLKIPLKWSKIKLGFVCQVVCYVRTSNSADTRTDSHRLIASSHYKSYS